MDCSFLKFRAPLPLRNTTNQCPIKYTNQKLCSDAVYLPFLTEIAKVSQGVNQRVQRLSHLSSVHLIQ